jgi:hypothetical protein
MGEWLDAAQRALDDAEAELRGFSVSSVRGFQDDFNAPTRDTNWLAFGPDVYAQAGGFLNLGAGSGDPNHLIYVNPAYNGSTQEVLARIKMTNVTSQQDAFAGIALGVPTNNADWIAWQFHRADLNEGIVQAFRRASNLTPSIGLRLQGLQSGATYEVINFEQATTYTATGSQLMDDGVTVRVATPPDAATVKYRKIPP